MLVTETSASRPFSYVIKFSIAQMVAMKSDVITLVLKVNSSKRSGIQSYLYNLCSIDKSTRNMTSCLKPDANIK